MNINRIRFVTAALLAIVCQGTTWGGDGQFTEHLLQAGFGYAYGLAAGDLNGDGKPELTVGDADKGELSGFVNQGTGAFQRFFVRQGEGSWLERHSLGDVDGDGNLDVVVVCNNASKVLWFKNPGNPITTQSWTRNVITQEFPNAYDVALSDFNGDGRPDVAASSYKSNCFAWFENPGSGSTAWSKHILEENVGETRTICVADFNGDGRSDLLGTSRTGNTVAWYENPTRANIDPWLKHAIDGVSSTPVHGHPVDMNADGKLDVVMAFGHLASAEAGQVAWYENLGMGAEWKKHIVGALPSGFEAVAGDLNGDGEPDIVATSWAADTLSGQLVWFENPGDPTGVWTRHLLKDQWARANSVLVVDLDADGRLDIVAATEDSLNEVRWWHNEMIHTPEPSTRSLSVAGLLGLATWHITRTRFAGVSMKRRGRDLDRALWR